MTKTKKDEIINKLILAIGEEVDYWLLESNRTLRTSEYGEITYRKLSGRFEKIRHDLFEAILMLPEVKNGGPAYLDSDIIKRKVKKSHGTMNYRGINHGKKNIKLIKTI